MADVSAKNAVNSITNDLKARAAFEAGEATGGFGGAQFLDVMMARLTALGSDDADLKAILKKAADAPEAPRETAFLKHTRGLRKKDAVENAAPVSEKEAADEKIRAKVAEIIARDETPVKDDRAVKLLKKVAEFLIKAEEQGKIDLPDELADALNIFLAQPQELKAAELVEFMGEFIALFRQLNVTLKPKSDAASALVGSEQSPDAELVWPKELADAFAELKLAGHAKPDQPIEIVGALKALKALVNASQNAGIDTLRDRAAAALVQQSEAEILIPKALTDKVSAAVETKPAAEAARAVHTAEILAAKLAADVAKPVEVAAVQKVGAVVQPSVPQAVVNVAAKAEQPLMDLSGPAPDAPAKDESSLVDLARLKANPPQNDSKEARSERAAQPSQGATPNNNAAAVAAAAVRAQSNAAAPAKSVAPALGPVDAGLIAASPDGDAAGFAAPAAANAAKFAKALNSVSAQQQMGQSNATQQVLVHIQNRAGKSSQLNIQLTPAELGKVEMRLNIQRDGSTHAVITVDKPETLALLQKDASQLEKALNQAGLNASQENMSFNLREQRQQSGGFSGRKRLGVEREDAAVKELALNVHNDGQIISDTRVNYHA